VVGLYVCARDSQTCGNRAGAGPEGGDRSETTVYSDSRGQGAGITSRYKRAHATRQIDESQWKCSRAGDSHQSLWRTGPGSDGQSCPIVET
jgi:hypothetical protein